ncbi:MAG: hypothetical protein U0165_03305 [Polyangiaceae bacterium]
MSNHEPQYEFSESQNKQLTQLAGSMRFVGIASSLLGGAALVMGAITIVMGKLSGGAEMVNGAFYLTTGLLTLSAATAFRKIVDTQGHDISLLMDAILSLKKIYEIQRIVIFVVLVLLVLAFFVGVSVGSTVRGPVGG